MSAQIASPNGSLLDRVLTRATSRVAGLASRPCSDIQTLALDAFLTSETLSASSIIIELQRSEAFLDRFKAPIESSKDLEKLFANELSRVAPICENVTIIPIHEPTESGLITLHIRTDLLDEIESNAIKLGVQKLWLSGEDEPDKLFVAPVYTRQSKLSRNLMVFSIALMLFSAWFGIGSIAKEYEDAANMLDLEERGLRGQVAARNDVTKDSLALEQLAGLNPEQTSPLGTLQRLSKLTMITPDTAFWTEVRLSPEGIVIVGVSDEAGETLQTFSEAYPNQSVRFAGSVTELQNGQQSYSISIRGSPDE